MSRRKSFIDGLRMQALLVRWTKFPVAKLHMVERGDQVVVGDRCVYVSTPDGRNIFYVEALTVRGRAELLRAGSQKHPIPRSSG